MSAYRRWFVPGGTYFFTVATQARRPILTEPRARSCLRGAIETVRRDRPFKIVAIVLMPDHLHTVWSLPPRDFDYSTRLRRIKGLFTRCYLGAGGVEVFASSSRVDHGERGVWQRRFWEHTIRDEGDMKNYLDYIHWNPVKHGFVTRVGDYPWSSFHRYVRLGEYNPEWCADDSIVNTDLE